MFKTYIVEPLNKLINFAKTGLDDPDMLRRLADFRFDLNNLWTQLLVLVLIIVLLTFILDFILSHTIFGNSYRVFVAPGVIIHELSHAFFCLITGAKIKSISLFDKAGGSVTHEPSKIMIVGPILIAFAPLFLGITAIFIISRWVGLDEQINIFSLSFSGLRDFALRSFSAINFANYQNWLLIYFAFSIGITMTPSFQDFKNAFSPLLFLAAVIYIIVKAVDLPTDLSFIPIEKLILLLSSIVVLLIFSIILSMIFFAVTKLIKR